MRPAGISVVPSRVVRGAIDWTFRSRTTGRLTVAQFPNPSLSIFLVASLIRRVAGSHGAERSVLDAVVTVSLGWWAVNELARGVNPWRRMLGAGVLALLVKGLAAR